MTAAPRALLLVTGDELLRGFVQDANSGFLARDLRIQGIELAQVRICGDTLHEIEESVRRGLEETAAALVIVTGGLGPTHDDRTSEAIANVTGRELTLDPRALEMVEARVRALGRMRDERDRAIFEPGNRKQATLPAGAVALDPRGTAPGYVLAAEQAVIVVLPGPPSELRYAWRQAVASPPLQGLIALRPPEHERLLRVWGVPESHAVALLEAAGHEDSAACRVTLCARDGELEISIRGSEHNRANALTERLCTDFGEHIFAVDDERPISELVGERVQAARLHLAVAESCTGGMLGSMLTQTAGASGYFWGGVISYDNSVKTGLLAVTQAALDEHGAVSEPVARQMALGVRAATGAELGIAITGIAGPGGGTDEKPVGTVYVALSGGEDEVQVRALRLPGDRDTIRRRSCMVALHMLREHLGTIPSG